MTRQLAALLLVFSLHAKADEGTLNIYCDAQEPRLHLTIEDSFEAGSVKKQAAVEFSGLISYAPGNDYGISYRTGSQFTTQECGRLSVKVSGGFLNGNPQGELGAIEYPIVQIFDGSTQIMAPTAIGTCESSNGRYGYSVECPANWTTQITVFDFRGKPSIHVVRTYEEYVHGL